MDTHASSIDIHAIILDSLEESRRCAVATVLKSAGSTPQKAGAKAIIDPAGSIRGTIGGGQVEAQAIRLAVEAITTGRPALCAPSATRNGNRPAPAMMPNGLSRWTLMLRRPASGVGPGRAADA